jgi:hypothetical protein
MDLSTRAVCRSPVTVSFARDPMMFGRSAINKGDRTHSRPGIGSSFGGLMATAGAVVALVTVSAVLAPVAADAQRGFVTRASSRATNPHPQPAPTGNPHPQAPPSTTHSTPPATHTSPVVTSPVVTPPVVTPPVVTPPATVSPVHSTTTTPVHKKTKTRSSKSSSRSKHPATRRRRTTGKPGHHRRPSHSGSTTVTTSSSATVPTTTVSRVRADTGSPTHDGSGGSLLLVVLLGLPVLALVAGAGRWLTHGSRLRVAAERHDGVAGQQRDWGTRRLNGSLGGLSKEEITVVALALVLSLAVGILAGRL